MPGCGKTTIGKQISSVTGILFLDMDESIVSKTGKTIAKIFEKEGEEEFRKREREILIELGKDNRPMIISTGGGAPCYKDNMDLMLSYGKTVYLRTSIAKLKKNLEKEKDSRPLLKGNLSIGIKQLLKEREPTYLRSSVVIENTSTPEEAVNQILKVIRN